MRCEAQGLRVDVFALAVVMWECLTGETPWKNMEMVQIILKVPRSRAQREQLESD
jgi:hypothetical protein